MIALDGNASRAMLRALALPLVAAAALGARPAVACSSDVDCKGNRICQAGTCVEPAPGSAANVAPVAAPAAAPRAPVGPTDATSSVYVNTLGVLQFGVGPVLEFGSKFAFNAKLQLFNTGALSYVIAGSGDDALKFSWGVGPGFRYYFGNEGNLRGGYWGAEALYVSWTEQWEQSMLYKTKALALLFEGGYRWVYANGWHVGVGLMAGPAPILSATSEPLNGYAYPDANDATTMFIGFFTVDVGFFL
jgi:hypothetical protein